MLCYAIVRGVQSVGVELVLMSVAGGNMGGEGGCRCLLCVSLLFMGEFIDFKDIHKVGK